MLNYWRYDSSGVWYCVDDKHCYTVHELPLVYQRLQEMRWCKSLRFYPTDLLQLLNFLKYKRLRKEHISKTVLTIMWGPQNVCNRKYAYGLCQGNGEEEDIKGKKVKLTLEQGMKAQRGSRDIVLLFL